MRTRCRTLGIGLASLLLLSARALAANFLEASYDPADDSLVVRLAYRGTHPDHVFSIQWGDCKQTARGTYTVEARVLDSQWNDRASKPFEITQRFALSELRCRPALLTIFTEPNFHIDVNVPSNGSTDLALRGPDTDAH